MTPRSSSRRDAASPAPARALLRISRGFGRDAAQARESGGWQRTERAASRGIGRAGHWLDRRNPEGMRGLAPGLVIGAGALALGLLILLARRGRHGG
jgi:hypothetical protein